MTTPGWPRSPASLTLVGDHDPATGSFLVVVHTSEDTPGPVQDAVAAQLRRSGEELLAPYAGKLSVGGTGLLVEDVVGQIKSDLTTGRASRCRCRCC